jgi:acetyl esterase/lipase
MTQEKGTTTTAPARMPAPPLFPAFHAPEMPEEVSEHSVVHRELSYAITVGFRRLAMDIWLPRTAAGPVPVVVWIHGGAFQLGAAANCHPPLPRIRSSGC